jgi:CRP-like cAMP-binding protein
MLACSLLFCNTTLKNQYHGDTPLDSALAAVYRLCIGRGHPLLAAVTTPRWMMELLEQLRQVPLFQSLSEDSLVKVGELFQEMVIPAGTYLSRQGDLGATFFVVSAGQAIVQRVDDKGYERPVGTVGEHNAFYGVTSLFVVVPRDATVIARTEMRVWVLHRPPFLALLEAEPAIERQLNIPPDVQARRQAPRYPWQEQGEQLAFATHKHWIVFARKMVGSTLLVAGLAALLLYLSSYVPLGLLAPFLLVPTLVLYVAVAFWHLVDWRNDYHAVTNRRLSYREHVALLYDSRKDAPLDQVQNVNVARTFLGQLLGYGQVIVQTAAAAGTMQLDHVDEPEALRKAIFDEQFRAMATRQAEQRWRIRATLADHVTLEELSAGGGGHPSIEQSLDYIDAQEPPRQMPNWFRRAIDWVSGLEVIPPIREHTPEKVVWRKHWLFLVISVVVPLVLVLILASFTVAFFATGGLFGLAPGGVAGLVTLGLTIVCFGWLFYEYTDWGNDQYIVTNERVIDVDQRPFWLSQSTREASLGKIQNVHYVVPNIIASLLRYGDVVVKTAGEGDFTFTHVPRPAEVQNEIFRRINNYRLLLQEQETEFQRRELAAWFSVYDDIKSGRPAVHEPAESESGPTPTFTDDSGGRTTL